MDRHLLQTTHWNPHTKIFLPQGRHGNRGKFLAQFQGENQRNLHGGFFEIEMLIWFSVIALILVGFLSIYRVYKIEHQKIQEEFTYEWNKLDAQRRNPKDQGQKQERKI
jgi:Ni,Fe-hydrogenase I large subunit